MKVLFTFGGIPHYLNALLEKLYKKGVDIVVVTPQKGNATIGQGVKMVEGGTYRHLTTPEKKMFYGKSAFPALPDLISREKPDLVVMGWPYFLQLFSNLVCAACFVPAAHGWRSVKFPSRLLLTDESAPTSASTPCTTRTCACKATARLSSFASGSSPACVVIVMRVVQVFCATPA